MRNDAEWLKDISDETELIEKYSVKGEDAFQRDELIQTRVGPSFTNNW